jgi:hypothetical protein
MIDAGVVPLDGSNLPLIIADIRSSGENFMELESCMMKMMMEETMN